MNFKNFNTQHVSILYVDKIIMYLNAPVYTRILCLRYGIVQSITTGIDCLKGDFNTQILVLVAFRKK